MVAADIADPAASAHLIETHRDRYGSLGVLVLNAGVGTAGGIVDLPMRRFDKTLQVNLRSPFRSSSTHCPCCAPPRATDPPRSEGHRHASITGVYAEAGLAAYGATKAAVISLVETLNAEESGNGVTATALAPAYVDTDMSAWVTDSYPASPMIPVDDVVGRRRPAASLTERCGQQGHHQPGRNQRLLGLNKSPGPTRCNSMSGPTQDRNPAYPVETEHGLRAEREGPAPELADVGPSCARRCSPPSRCGPSTSPSTAPHTHPPVMEELKA